MNRRLFVVGIGDNLVKRCAKMITDGNKNGDLSRIAVVFPGLRPNIYLLKYLSDIYNNVFVPPVRFSIETFIEYLAKKKVPKSYPVDMIDANYILYNIVNNVRKNYLNRNNEVWKEWDEFFPLGVKLVEAIDELDVYQVPEQEIKGIEELEREDETVGPYVRDIWKSMSVIRSSYHNELEKRCYTTRGLNYLYAAQWVDEMGESALSEFDKVYFVGFNALNKSEEKIMKSLWELGKAEVLWQSNIEKIYEAREGTPYYFHRNIWELWDKPELIPLSPSIEKDYNKYKFYKGFDTHSQLRKVKELLDDGKEYENVAVVLPDESAIIPAIEEIVLLSEKKFNITMGYALSRTPIYNLFEFIFKAQENKMDGEFYWKDYLSVMKHPYVKGIYSSDNDIIQRLEYLIKSKDYAFVDIKSVIDDMVGGFAPEDIVKIEKLHNLLFMAFQHISTLNDLANAVENVINEVYKNPYVKKYNPAQKYFASMIEIVDALRSLEIFNLEFDTKVLYNIFRGYAKTKKVHFSGEPLQGIQIMGMLETRALKFDRVIIIDVNEGIVPGVYKYDPILPMGIRNLLGLSNYIQRESLYAYNFFRLIDGASDVHIIYNTSEDWNGKNIRSRFIEQIVWEIERETGKSPEEDVISFNLKFEPPKPIFVAKTEKAINAIKDMEFSPSRLDTYIKCPLRFYYQYILGLYEEGDIEESPDAVGIGDVIHKTLERFFREYIGKSLKISEESYRKIGEVLKGTLEEKYGEIENNGNLLLFYEVAKDRLRKFLDKERGRKSKILSLEQSYGKDGDKPAITIDITSSDAVSIGGRIDRVDKEGDGYLIIDYKTGRMPEKPTVSGALDADISSPREFMKEYIMSTQLPVYILLYTNSGKEIDYENTNAGLYTLRDIKINWLFDEVEKDVKVSFIKKFIEVLRLLIKEIWNPDIPFEPDTGDERYCEYCPFSSMCQK